MKAKQSLEREVLYKR